MLMIDSTETKISGRGDFSAGNEELNRLLCAAVVSKNFRSMLLENPELAVSSGYQGESFNLSDQDRNWLFSIRPNNLVDLATNLVTYHQRVHQEFPVKLDLEQATHLQRLN